jgi:FlaG/FlaF family flagellin (archaellin)
MGVRAWWGERSQGEKVAVGLAGGFCLLPVLLGAVVVVAAVVGAFVLGVGDPATTESPQVQFEFETTDGGVAITHAGGDTVRASNLRVVVDGTAQAWPGQGDVTAGDRVTVAARSGSTVRVVWDGAEGSATLGVYTA